MRVFAYGRLSRFPSRTWERLLAQTGGRRVRRIGDADVIVVGAGAASKSTPQIWSELAQKPPNATTISERSFLRRIGLEPEQGAETLPYTAGDLAGRAKVPVETVNLLALFGAVDVGKDGRFGFRAPRAISTAAALMASGVSLAKLVAACDRLRSASGASEPLAEFDLTSEPGGHVVLRSGEHNSDLDGQLRLALAGEQSDASAILAEAAEARDSGDNELAVRLSRRALGAAPRDVDALFDLGSLLCEMGEFTEGISLLNRAVRLSPKFADGWYNIGHAYEQQGRREEARQAYERAAAADPAYADPLYNLGMMALDEERFADSIERLDAYLRLDGSSEWAGRARKAATLARLSQSKGHG